MCLKDLVPIFCKGCLDVLLLPLVSAFGVAVLTAVSSVMMMWMCDTLSITQKKLLLSLSPTAIQLKYNVEYTEDKLSSRSGTKPSRRMFMGIMIRGGQRTTNLCVDVDAPFIIIGYEANRRLWKP